MDNAKLKQKAKKKLEGKFGDAATFIIIYFCINMAVSVVGNLILGTTNFDESAVNGFNSLLSIIVDSLLIFGSYSYFLKIARGKKVTYKELFSRTDMFVPALVIGVLTSIITVVGFILLIVPGIIALLMLSQTYFIALDNKELSPVDCMKQSKALMAGHKMEFFLLGLSFIGWIIGCVFTFGLLSIYVAPYMGTTFALYYDSIKK